jgi:RES domain-containing protein
VVHDPTLLDVLERLDATAWQGRVFRHVFGAAVPELANVRGARWNPPGIAALYTSLTAATAEAEGDHLISLQPVPPRTTRAIYEIELEIKSLLDLRAAGRLDSLGIDEARLGADDMGPCQAIGGAVKWLGHDGLLVPSARDDGANLVLFTSNRSPDSVMRVRRRREL